ncbi:N-carbamoylputrescine amidase [Bradyrhizobium diazoefficiens]|uniref:carbon-nitrogen hydrolase family protein n=1 Tax=Bradyrhizobium TaxID=374 RepID=UPI001495CC78|nr:carbon-nitrogen hydrolase family protein [Bradyrhizobium diazoefficiens]MBR0866520.1 carbon-nitrogen hydrolase family protein [Bradyrhizobium diazoefficiens]MBR0892147.1 carbon-nitrogen hydrolase family protein [Bradyrhizobium diazoefficiens]MBR0923834.1 carbon-nitrogen hydrolase family protein [Bradyrhizobium diazoefficiens]WLA66502.1 carbon-nitrogen hydrolase family protein [Bradyrhizobium diazoefficiens]
MTFRVATCEFPDRTDEVSAMWRRLERELAKAPVDLLVLPELAGVDSFWGSPVFSEVVWRQAVTTHAKISDELKRLTAKRALGTRAVEVDTRRWNETFLWKPESGLVRGRPKAWLPQQEGGWEATWFDRGPQNVLPVRDDELCFAELVCTEIMVSTAARRLGQAGVQLIAAPRATGGHPRWEVATRMAAIAAGAFVVTANRRGGSLAGGSWIVAPDGDVLARTSEGNPIISLEIDLAAADAAKQTYPRNVRD